MQQFGGGLELLMFEQAPHERFARIFVRILLGGIDARQQHPRLDVDECRGHDEKLPGDIQVQVLHQVDVLEILLA